MKQNIHPPYFKNAKVTCACGNSFTVGATTESMEVETCSACHPAYTGKQTGNLRGSRVERFKERLEKHEKLRTTVKTKKPRARKTAS